VCITVLGAAGVIGKRHRFLSTLGIVSEESKLA
jgi:hypothetical protein